MFKGATLRIWEDRFRDHGVHLHQRFWTVKVLLRQAAPILSQDGRRVGTGNEEPVVNITELASGKRIDSLKGSRICIDVVGLTSDARTLATRTVDEAMKFWQVATGKEIFTLGPPNPVHSFLFPPNGEYLAITWASGSRGGRRVELWRAPSFEEIIAAEKEKARN